MLQVANGVTVTNDGSHGTRTAGQIALLPNKPRIPTLWIQTGGKN